MPAINWIDELPANWNKDSLAPYFVLIRGPDGVPLDLIRAVEKTLVFYDSYDANSPNTVVWAPADEVLAAIKDIVAVPNNSDVENLRSSLIQARRDLATYQATSRFAIESINDALIPLGRLIVDLG